MPFLLPFRFGGAISETDSTKMQLTNSSFSHCNATLGGSLYLRASSILSGSGVRFSGSTAQKGGAVFLDKNCTFEVTNLTAADNKARASGGAFSINERSSVILDDFLLLDNRAMSIGGAIDCQTGGRLTFHNQGVVRCNNAREGGGIYAHRCHVTIDNTWFVQNEAGVKGGAIFSLSNHNMEIYNSWGYRNKLTHGQRGRFLFLSASTLNSTYLYLRDSHSLGNVLLVTNGSRAKISHCDFPEDPKSCPLRISQGSSLEIEARKVNTPLPNGIGDLSKCREEMPHGRRMMDNNGSNNVVAATGNNGNSSGSLSATSGNSNITEKSNDRSISRNLTRTTDNNNMNATTSSNNWTTVNETNGNSAAAESESESRKRKKRVSEVS